MIVSTECGSGFKREPGSFRMGIWGRATKTRGLGNFNAEGYRMLQLTHIHVNTVLTLPEWGRRSVLDLVFGLVDPTSAALSSVHVCGEEA